MFFGGGVLREGVSELTDATEASITAHALHARHATSHTTHTTHTCHVVLRSGVLLVFVNPLRSPQSVDLMHCSCRLWRTTYLVEVGLQEMHLFALLEKPWPVFLLLFLFPEHKLHIPRAVMRLAVLDVDLAVELQHDVVGCLLGIGGAGEG